MLLLQSYKFIYGEAPVGVFTTAFQLLIIGADAQESNRNLAWIITSALQAQDPSDSQPS